MLFWSDFVGAAVMNHQKKIGHIENILFDPGKKVIIGFLLERRNWDVRYRVVPFIQIQEIKRDNILLREGTDINTLSKNERKKFFLTEEILNRTILDEKGEWVGRVVDFGFDPSKGFLREIILSGSFLEDLWNGRKKMPVLSQVEFSGELITIDQDTREEITSMHKGLKNWFETDTIQR